MIPTPGKFFGLVVHIVEAGTVVDCYGPGASARVVTERTAVLGAGECWMTQAQYDELAKPYRAAATDRGPQ